MSKETNDADLLNEGRRGCKDICHIRHISSCGLDVEFWLESVSA